MQNRIKIIKCYLLERFIPCNLVGYKQVPWTRGIKDIDMKATEGISIDHLKKKISCYNWGNVGEYFLAFILAQPRLNSHGVFDNWNIYTFFF